MEKIILSSYTPEQLQGFVSEALNKALKAHSLSEAPKDGANYLSRKQVAEMLKISLVTLRDYSKKGILKSYLIGGRVLYKESEIEKSLYQVKPAKY